MGRLKILCVGYRKWSIDLFENLLGNYFIVIAIITSKKSLTYEIIKKLDPNIILFYGWSWIVDNKIIENYFCLCLHPSKLPEYRGGSPIQNQIINGEKYGAVSIFRMTKDIDDGNICFQEEISLDGNIKEIYKRIFEVGLKATMQIIDKFIQNKIEFISQKSELSTFYKRRTPEQSEITQEELKNCSSQYLFNKIRMLTDPYPNAYIVCSDGKKLFLTESYIES